MSCSSLTSLSLAPVRDAINGAVESVKQQPVGIQVVIAGVALSAIAAVGYALAKIVGYLRGDTGEVATPETLAKAKSDLAGFVSFAKRAEQRAEKLATELEKAIKYSQYEGEQTDPAEKLAVINAKKNLPRLQKESAEAASNLIKINAQLEAVTNAQTKLNEVVITPKADEALKAEEDANLNAAFQEAKKAYGCAEKALSGLIKADKAQQEIIALQAQVDAKWINLIPTAKQAASGVVVAGTGVAAGTYFTAGLFAAYGTVAAAVGTVTLLPALGVGAAALVVSAVGYKVLSSDKSA